MKLIIDISKGEYDKICKTMLHTSSGNPNFYFESKIANGTPIPDNATNGDCVRKLFCKGIYRTSVRTNVSVEFNKDWWNSLYQKGGKE